ncbi:MAG: hypothetical protein ACT4NU_10705 [Chromatiales bacterium]
MIGQWLKRRTLKVRAPSPADAVAARLQALPGIELAQWAKAGHLVLHYDVRTVTLEVILERARSLGIAIPVQGLSAWWHRFLVYCDENHRRTGEADAGWEAAVRALYVSCSRQQRHGRRDERPQHWRKYLERDADD